MNTTINIDLDNQLEKVKELFKELEKLDNKSKLLTFITPTELAKAMGISVEQTRKIFNRKDFPSCDYGKEKVAEISAVKEYFRVKRSTRD